MLLIKPRCLLQMRSASFGSPLIRDQKVFLRGGGQQIGR